MIAPSKPVVKTALPLELHEMMINTPVLSNNNPYNRLLTAIEEMEKNETEQSQEQSNFWDDSNSILLQNSK